MLGWGCLGCVGRALGQAVAPSPAFPISRRSDGRRTSRWGSPLASCTPGGGACGTGMGGAQWEAGSRWGSHRPPLLPAHSVFWDLYCAAPDRREACERSDEAKAFQDYVSAHPRGWGRGGACDLGELDGLRQASVGQSVGFDLGAWSLQGYPCAPHLVQGYSSGSGKLLPLHPVPEGHHSLRGQPLLSCPSCEPW